MPSKSSLKTLSYAKTLVLTWWVMILLGINTMSIMKPLYLISCPVVAGIFVLDELRAAGDVGVMNISISCCRHNPVIAGLRHKPGTADVGTMVRRDRYENLQSPRTEETTRLHVISYKMSG